MKDKINFSGIILLIATMLSKSSGAPEASSLIWLVSGKYLESNWQIDSSITISFISIIRPFF